LEIDYYALQQVWAKSKRDERPGMLIHVVHHMIFALLRNLTSPRARIISLLADLLDRDIAAAAVTRMLVDMEFASALDYDVDQFCNNVADFVVNILTDWFIPAQDDDEL
jgi:hypothetical protein